MIKKPKLPKETDSHYYTLEPIYDHYKTVRVANYCECCGQKTGYHKEQRGVKIVLYKIHKHKKDAWYYTEQLMLKQIADNIATSSPIVEMIMNRKKIEGISKRKYYESGQK